VGERVARPGGDAAVVARVLLRLVVLCGAAIAAYLLLTILDRACYAAPAVPSLPSVPSVLPKQPSVPMVPVPSKPSLAPPTVTKPAGTTSRPRIVPPPPPPPSSASAARSMPYLPVAQVAVTASAGRSATVGATATVGMTGTVSATATVSVAGLVQMTGTVVSTLPTRSVAGTLAASVTISVPLTARPAQNGPAQQQNASTSTLVPAGFVGTAIVPMRPPVVGMIETVDAPVPGGSLIVGERSDRQSRPHGARKTAPARRWGGVPAPPAPSAPEMPGPSGPGGDVDCVARTAGSAGNSSGPYAITILFHCAGLTSFAGPRRADIRILGVLPLSALSPG